MSKWAFFYNSLVPPLLPKVSEQFGFNVQPSLSVALRPLEHLPQFELLIGRLQKRTLETRDTIGCVSVTQTALMKGRDDLHSCWLLNSLPGDLASFDPLKDELMWEKRASFYHFIIWLREPFFFNYFKNVPSLGLGGGAGGGLMDFCHLPTCDCFHLLLVSSSEWKVLFLFQVLKLAVDFFSVISWQRLAKFSVKSHWFSTNWSKKLFGCW